MTALILLIVFIGTVVIGLPVFFSMGFISMYGLESLGFKLHGNSPEDVQRNR